LLFFHVDVYDASFPCSSHQNHYPIPRARVQILGFVDEKDDKGKHVYGMVMPRLARSLRNLLDESAGGEGVPLPTRLRIIEELARALAFVHADGVVHADLKSPNVLLDDGGHVQLTDFGLASTKQLTSSTEASLRSVQSSPTFVGTWEWGAPETHPHPDTGECGAPTFKSDVYSLGTVIFEVATDAVPFRAAPNIRNRASAIPALILKGRRPADYVPYPDDVPVDLRTLIADCWVADPKARPSARDVVTRVRAIVESVSPAKDSDATFVELLKARLLDPHAIPPSRADLEALFRDGSGGVGGGSGSGNPASLASSGSDSGVGGSAYASNPGGSSYASNPSTPSFAWLLPPAAIKTRAPLFAACDADGDGFVQNHELYRLMSSDADVGRALLAHDAELFSLADVDRDRKLSAVEFQLLLHAAAAAGASGAMPPPPTDADVAAASAALQRFNMAVILPVDGNTKLHAMAAAGSVPQIKELLALFVNPDAANKAGARPLHVVSSADAGGRRACIAGGWRGRQCARRHGPHAARRRRAR
jgi:serine/threonine protein kinase